MSPKKISLGKIGERRRAKKEHAEGAKRSGRAAGALSVPDDVGTAREMPTPGGTSASRPAAAKKAAAKKSAVSTGDTANTPDRKSRARKSSPGKKAAGREGVVDSLDTTGAVHARRLVVPDEVRAEYGLSRDA